MIGYRVETLPSLFAVQWQDRMDPWGWETDTIYASEATAVVHRNMLRERLFESMKESLPRWPDERVAEAAKDTFRVVELRVEGVLADEVMLDRHEPCVVRVIE